MRPTWDKTILDIFTEAMLEVPTVTYDQVGGRAGLHSEGLGHLLAEMQSVHRAHPGATW